MHGLVLLDRLTCKNRGTSIHCNRLENASTETERREREGSFEMVVVLVAVELGQNDPILVRVSRSNPVLGWVGLSVVHFLGLLGWGV